MLRRGWPRSFWIGVCTAIILLGSLSFPFQALAQGDTRGDGDASHDSISPDEIGSVRARLAEVERSREKIQTRPLAWRSQTWPRELRTGSGIRQKGSLVELVYDTRDLNVTVTFEPVKPGLESESVEILEGDESLRVPLTIEGSEWVALPSGRWIVSIYCAKEHGESRLYGIEKVKLGRGQAYTLRFTEREEREALHLMGEGPRRMRTREPARAARAKQRGSEARMDSPLGSGSAPRQERNL